MPFRCITRKHVIYFLYFQVKRFQTIAPGKYETIAPTKLDTIAPTYQPIAPTNFQQPIAPTKYQTTAPAKYQNPAPTTKYQYQYIPLQNSVFNAQPSYNTPTITPVPYNPQYVYEPYQPQQPVVKNFVPQQQSVVPQQPSVPGKHS